MAGDRHAAFSIFLRAQITNFDVFLGFFHLGLGSWLV